MPSAKSVTIWITDFVETGSALNKMKPKQKATIRTPENIAAGQRRPHKESRTFQQIFGNRIISQKP